MPGYSSSSKEDISEIKENVKNVYQQANETATEALHKAERKLRNVVNAASDKISEATDTTTRHVRANPIQSLLIALGVGYVLGKLFRR